MVRRISLFLLPIVILIGSIILSRTESQNPHGQLKWDCQDCHTADSWTKMKESPKFDHAETGFPLGGAHATAQCIGCHKTPVFSHVATECSDCHSDHHKGQLGTQCQNCHTPRDWKNRREVLSTHIQRGFPLAGAHATADCEMCHTGAAQQQFAGTSTNCFDCHTSEFTSAANPNHVQNNFDHDCTKCHSSSSWNPARFDHALTSFPLTGQHQTVACITCHPATFAGTTSDCYTCHQTDFAATTSPNHAQSAFSHDCLLCHTTNGWTPSSFNHSTTTFPLTGKHQTTTCLSCHPTTYAGTTTDCYTCHQTAFTATTNPNHTQANFGHDCVSCHTTNGWTPSSFNHSTTSFALTGKHQTTNCISCHPTTYAGTAATCDACHQTNFNATTNPNHTSAGFSTDCVSCHNTSAWDPSTWDHDAQNFPIYSGAHDGQWADCATCHTNPATYADFTCFTCHRHNQTDTDNNHSQVNGYAYTSSACYTCHPRGVH
jgi:hypothetical protein